MNGQKHIINRQVVEVATPERSGSMSIQNKISEVVRQKLHPSLDVVFSKISGSKEIIRIDKLVVDLGTISEKELENVFVEKAVKEIEEKINKLLKAEINRAIPISDNGSNTVVQSKITIASRPEDAIAQFVFFLKTGRLPWWHISSGTNKFLGANALENIFAEVLKTDAERLKNDLLPLFGKTDVRQRLVFQFNTSQLNTLIKKITERRFELFYSQFQVLLSSFSSATFYTFKPLITEHFYKIVLKYIHEKLELSNEVRKIDFVKEILNSVWNQFQKGEIEITGQTQSAMEIFRNEIFNENVPGSDKNKIAVNKLVEQFFEKLKENSAILIETKKAEPAGTSLRSNDKTGIKSRENKVSLFAPKLSTDAENITIYNAGLVLVHPFFRYFFEGLNLLDHDLGFKSQFHAFKAIFLLQYIVTGEESAMETELMLNKIFCGIDVTEPIPKSIPLSAEEKEECVHLIKTILERWGSLKTSNPDALRKTYLQREGILRVAGEGWNLKIERNTFDVMLEKLPWSVNLVRLPWSSQLIYVEW